MSTVENQVKEAQKVLVPGLDEIPEAEMQAEATMFRIVYHPWRKSAKLSVKRQANDIAEAREIARSLVSPGGSIVSISEL